ncbi:MAG: hypothetical protein LQ352_001232 [Teloschistes flavicans]|nr:MAG: hypothetical protein LQ352_001232 [Teloschistes flavicans]
MLLAIAKRTTDALGNRNNHLVVAESASVTFEANEPSTSLSSDSKVAEENGKYPTDNPILSHSKQSSQQFESVISTAVSPFETCTSTAQIACPDLKQALKPSSLVMQENLDHSLRSREDGTSSAAATPSVEAKPSPPVPGGFLHQIFHWLPSFLFVFFRKRI